MQALGRGDANAVSLYCCYGDPGDGANASDGRCVRQAFISPPLPLEGHAAAPALWEVLIIVRLGIHVYSLFLAQVY